MKLFKGAPCTLVKTEGIKRVAAFEKNALFGDGGEHAQARGTQIDEVDTLAPAAEDGAQTSPQWLQSAQTFRPRTLGVGCENGEIPVTGIRRLTRATAEQKGQAYGGFPRKELPQGRNTGHCGRNLGGTVHE